MFNDNKMNNDGNEKIGAIFLAILALILTIAAVQLVGYLFDLLRVKTGVPVANIKQSAIIESISTDKDNEIIIHQLSFTPPSYNYDLIGNPYNGEQNYLKNSEQLALIGNFESAKLIIKGQLFSDQDHYLSINVGNESGVYNAVRSGNDRFNKELTRENLGAFSKEEGINLTIDLMTKQTLATTEPEFIQTTQPTKLVRFWDEIKPQPPIPSVNRLLTAIFNEMGEYTGTITTLQFEYTCAEGSTCDAAICQYGEYEYESQCIKDYFGSKAEKEYLKYVK